MTDARGMMQRCARVAVLASVALWLLIASVAAFAQTAACTGTGTLNAPWQAGGAFDGSTRTLGLTPTAQANAVAAIMVEVGNSCAAGALVDAGTGLVNWPVTGCGTSTWNGQWSWTDAAWYCTVQSPPPDPPPDPPPEPAAMTAAEATFAVGLVVCMALGWVAGRQR